MYIMYKYIYILYIVKNAILYEKMPELAQHSYIYNLL